MVNSGTRRQPRSWRLLALLLSVLWLPVLSVAGDLGTPTGEVLLSVEGKVDVRNSNSGARLDYALLAEIGFVTRTITTDWTESAEYEGVSGRELVEFLGISGAYLQGIAHDDYEVLIPLSDLVQYDTLFAVAKDGERLSMKNKGPIWLLYANDNRPDISPEVLNSRMIWQLHTLVSQ